MQRLSSHKLARLLATVALALMVIALGAAAKHSQFETGSGNTQYLKQSVKMVTADQHTAALAEPAYVLTEPFPALPTPVQLEPEPLFSVFPPLTPLLI